MLYIYVGSDTKSYVANQYAESPGTNRTRQIKSPNHLGPPHITAQCVRMMIWASLIFL